MTQDTEPAAPALNENLMPTPAPRIYDITQDDFRPATQADLDRLQDGCQALGLLRRVLRKLTQPPAADEPFDVKAYIEALRQIDDMLPSDPVDKVLR
jgi:hypothetical protein